MPADIFEAVRLRLAAAGLGGAPGRPGSLALTSLARGEGVSTVAVGLAAAMAAPREGAVLLVDGALSGVRCAELLGIPEPPQVAPVDADQLPERAQPVPGRGFDLLQLAAAPTLPDSPGVEAWAAAWQELCARYAHVVVDAGSLKAHAALRWAAWAGHTALVIDSSRTTREMLAALQRDQRHGGPRLSGFILNKRRFHVPASLYRALS